MEYDRTLLQVLREEEKRQAINKNESGKDNNSEIDDFLAACYVIMRTPPKSPPARNYKSLEEYLPKREKVKNLGKVNTYELVNA